MEAARGPNRGSYIFGKSVHNTRIERLWFDVTKDFGGGWKRFARDLQDNEGFDLDNPVHIWLFQYLFLDQINRDAIDWANHWNCHIIKMPRGQRDTAPRELWLFGMLQHGLRGFTAQDLTPADMSAEDIYGIDWEVLDDRRLMRHMAEVDAREQAVGLQTVTVSSPRCPFTDAELDDLDKEIHTQLDSSDPRVDNRRLKWRIALALVSPPSL
ncbi:hypothetical protein SISNIDRAFT_417275 [Sistotremastrum niveocremeum HHB9708]|uniref:Integrase core domain-containing protein n=1 Tax=Sistotremastrum niveocremeum HHB9708 TaxID=1314777 RepID=A0A164PUQ0_9AGAM|nr:hypothetical protein SISNIDRAFT_417275 [Sistotremastrum niveocremeum HHB9708]